MNANVGRRMVLAGASAFALFASLRTFSPARSAQGDDLTALPLGLGAAFAGAVFIEARADPVDPLLVKQDKPVVLFGQQILLDGIYATEGQPLAIIGREITITNGSRIDSTALRGAPHFLPGNRAKDGQGFGDDGAAGAAGGSGTRGGDVLIVCDRLSGVTTISAGGGAGGDGQTGGYGKVGATGGDGRLPPECDDGKRGGRGGKGGAGGAGGSGGAGGTVTIISRSSIPPAQIAATAPGGTGGRAGRHGTAAAGGAGGRGTSAWEPIDGHGQPH